MLRITAIILVLFSFISATAQPSKSVADSIAHVKDSIRMERFTARAIYPLIKSSKMTGVLPVPNATEIPDPNMEYKILFELAGAIADSAEAKKLYYGLEEVGRVINLHLASGVPLKKLNVAVVVHGSVIYSICNNESYHKKYGIDNPNLPLLEELRKAGVRFMSCGQAMGFQEISKEELLPFVKVSLTAQTVVTSYQLKGFVLMQR